MTLLSVVVPAYNARRHLTATLASLRSNAADGIEFVVVDDASTDGTAETVEAVQGEIPGLRLIRSPRNVGLASARNLGLAQARGRYLMFMDADDWLGRGYLAALLQVAFRHDVDFVRTDHVQVRGLKRKVHRAPVVRRGRPLSARDHIAPSTETTMVDYPYAWAGIFDRERIPDALLRFDAGLRTAEDRPWIWRLHRRCESFVVADLAGYFYRREVATSLTSALDERQLDFTVAFATVIRELETAGEPIAFLEKAARTTCVVVAHHLARADEMTAPVRNELERRSALLLRSVPNSLLQHVLETVDPVRQDLLRSLLRGHRVAGVERAAFPRLHRELARVGG